jgi:HAMP domain-containing protein
VLLWIIVAMAVAGIVLMVWRWWAGRPSGLAVTPNSVVAGVTSEIPIVPEPEPDAPVLRTGIELALQALDERRDPADAVVRAWLGLQESAEDAGIVRWPAETPTEFTSRILSRAFADDLPVRTLLRLYLRTRFGDHPVTADDVTAVRAALQELVRSWPAPASLTGGRR